LRRLLWLSILLALPWTARADDAGGPEAPLPPAIPAAIARADAMFATDLDLADPALADPSLDLHVDPTWPSLQRTRPVRSTASPAQPERGAQGPLSFRLAVQTRPEVGDEARQEHDEPPGIGEKVEGVVRRSTIGLKGIYRF
jgi:hypothetical protein